MPYTKDVRVGQGWFNFNLSWFYDYLSGIEEELVVCDEFCPSEIAYHNKEMEELIEEKVNEYISWKVFGETRSKLDEEDSLPKEYDEDIYGYIHDAVVLFIKRKPTWYKLNTTNESE